MSTDGFIFSQDGKTLVKCDFSKLGTFVNVPAGVTKIGNGVFAEAPVVKVILPDTVTEIGQNLFSSCETLEEVKLPSNLTSLKPFTFAGCTSLRKVTMPDNITSFPEGLFWGCSSLEEIPFRNGMESLETDVCRDCENITSLLIPPTVKTIKTGALAGCTKLSTIVFPDGLEKIEDRSLCGLQSLQYMRFSGDCDNFFVDENGGCLYQLSDKGAVLIKCPVNVESVYLVENTCDVHIDAFECCNSLTEVYASENAPEELINKLLELVPSIDVNSYSDEPSEEEEFSSKIQHLGEDLDQVQVNSDEFSEIGEFTQNDSDEDDETETEENSASTDMDSRLAEILGTSSSAAEEPVMDSDAEISINQNELESILTQHNVVTPETVQETQEDSAQEMSEDQRIQEILNSQVCRNDSLDEGFRPISMDELENLMNKPVVDPMEQLRAQQESSSESQSTEPVLENSSEMSEDQRIQEILNSQVCRNDSLDEGFRPILMDELENLMNKPVVDPMEQLRAQQESSSESQQSDNSYVADDEQASDEDAAIYQDEGFNLSKDDEQAGLDFIQSIVSQQCCNNDDYDEGFRPVTNEELERLMQDPPVDPETMIETESTTEAAEEDKPKRKRASRKSKKTEETEDSSEDKPKRKRARKTADESSDSTEDKPKRKRASKKSKKTEEVSDDTAQVSATESESVSETQPVEEKTSAVAASSEEVPAEEPRFIRAMKNLASHQMVLEDNGNKIDNVYGDLKELLVIADGVAPSTNDFSSHLVKFSKAVAKKYGFTKIYFFEDLPLDNPEFIYGLESFGNFRNVLYACNKPSAENISTEQKDLINAAGISLPASSKIHSVKEMLADVELQYPVKILVQDNYIEGLLYCAEKYREDHGIK